MISQISFYSHPLVLGAGPGASSKPELVSVVANVKNMTSTSYIYHDAWKTCDKKERMCVARSIFRGAASFTLMFFLFS